MTNSDPASSPAVANRALVPADLPAIAALQAAVFGPGRFARTAYRVREGTPPISPFCRGAFCGPQLIASLRLTAIAIGASKPHLLLGPLAVAPEFAGLGFGRALVSEALADAKTSGIGLVVLVGDLSYYERFGFVAVKPGQIAFPGPVNRARILACEVTPGVLSSTHGVIVATPV